MRISGAFIGDLRRLLKDIINIKINTFFTFIVSLILIGGASGEPGFPETRGMIEVV